MAQVRQPGKRTPDRGHCPPVTWLVSVGTRALSLQNPRAQADTSSSVPWHET